MLDSVLEQYAHSEDLLGMLVRVNVFFFFCFLWMKEIVRGVISWGMEAYTQKRSEDVEH